MQVHSKDSFIVEAGYDTRNSGWVVHRVRDRKTRPNAILTAWNTLEVVAENVTEDELRRVLGAAAPAARPVAAQAAPPAPPAAAAAGLSAPST